MRITSKVLILAIGLFSASVLASALDEELRTRYSANELLEFNAGEVSAVALQQPAQVTLPRGMVVIIVDPLAQGLTLPVAHRLAKRLSRWGWHATLLPMDYASPPPVQAALLPEVVSRYTDNTQSPLSHSEISTQMMLRVGGVFNALSDRQGYRIIIAQGMNAAVLLNLDAQKKLPAVDSLVTIAPFWPDQTINQNIANLVKDSQTPLLDISSDLSNRWSAQTARQRAQAAKINLKLHYRQQPLVGTFAHIFSDPDFASPYVSQVSKTIYSWVDYLGW